MTEPTPSPEIAPPLQLMLDGNIADVLLEDEILRNGLRDLLDARAAEVYVTHIVVDEILKTPDEELRARKLLTLFAIGARLVPTSGFVLDTSRLGLATLGSERAINAFMEGNRRHLEDALIATTARDQGMPLATAEKSRGRLSRHLPELTVMSVQNLRDAVNQRLVTERRLDPGQLDLVRDIQRRIDK